MHLIEELNDIKFYYSGHLVYDENPAGKRSAAACLQDYAAARLDFNALLGSFRVIIEDGRRGVTLHFCDNSGSLCFFHDGKYLSDSFLELLGRQDTAAPDYDAVAQFVQFECVYGLATVCKGIRRTDPGKYYVTKEGVISEHSKELTPFDSLQRFDDLHGIIGALVNGLDAEEIGCVITGGVDSRMILGHLLAFERPVRTFISGDASDADVRIAKEVSDAVGLELSFADNTFHADWIRRNFVMLDGMYGVFGLNRFCNLTQMIRQSGVQRLFGGMSGEFFKNSFINQDFPFYWGREQFDKFYRMKIAVTDFPQALCGELIRQPMADMKKTVMTELVGQKGQNKAQTYLNMGWKITQYRAITLSNSLQFYYDAVNPLMERDAMALIYHQNPYRLELQRFHRKEVSRYCPAIKGIRTYQGLSCDDSATGMLREIPANYLFLGKVAFQRIFNRRTCDTRPTGPAGTFTDSSEYARALEIVKNLKIIPPQVDTLPLQVASRVMTLGLLFDAEYLRSRAVSSLLSDRIR